MSLFLLVPLNLLAAQAISDLASRRVSVRWLSWLAPATAVSVAWWLSGDLQGAVVGLTHGHVGPRSALGLHLAVDLLIAVVWLARGLDRWARRRDLRQRRVLAGFLLIVILTSLADGLREVTFRHLETRELMNLRAAVLLRHRARPFRSIAVVGPGPGPPPDRRADARRPAPVHPPLDPPRRPRGRPDHHRPAPGLEPPDGPQLVVLVGPEHRLSYSVQSQLGLEAIHPGQAGRPGLLDAFATDLATTRHAASASSTRTK